MVSGYFQYHAVPGNEERLKAFRTTCCGCGCASYGGGASGAVGRWERFMERLGVLLPAVEILHPYPTSASTPNIRGRNRVR